VSRKSIMPRSLLLTAVLFGAITVSCGRSGSQPAPVVGTYYSDQVGELVISADGTFIQRRGGTPSEAFVRKGTWRVDDRERLHFTNMVSTDPVSGVLRPFDFVSTTFRIPAELSGSTKTGIGGSKGAAPSANRGGAGWRRGLRFDALRN
jgi:hypothetical protein